MPWEEFELFLHSLNSMMKRDKSQLTMGTRQIENFIDTVIWKNIKQNPNRAFKMINSQGTSQWQITKSYFEKMGINLRSTNYKQLSKEEWINYYSFLQHKNSARSTVNNLFVQRTRQVYDPYFDLPSRNDINAVSFLMGLPSLSKEAKMSSEIRISLFMDFISNIAKDYGKISLSKGLAQSGLTPKIINIIQKNSKQTMNVQDLLHQFANNKSGHILGLDSADGLYHALGSNTGLTTFYDAYLEFKMGMKFFDKELSQHVAKFLQKVVDTDQKIVFLIPKNLTSHQRARVTAAELSWFLENPKERMKNVYFVFGAYDHLPRL